MENSNGFVQVESLGSVVAERLKEYILRNNLKPGSLLPTESELSAQLGVGRSTIREAKALLKNAGILESRQGKGTVIRDFALTDTLKQFQFGLQLTYDDALYSDLFEARYIVEIMLSDLIVERITEDEILQLEEANRRYLESEGIPDRFYQDAQFHNILVNSIHNVFIVEYGKIILDLAKIKHFLLTNAFDGLENDTYEDHKQLIEYCKLRDKSGYKDLITRHLTRLKPFFTKD